MSQGDSNPAAIPHAAEDIQETTEDVSGKGGARVVIHKGDPSFLEPWPKLQKGVFNGQQELITVNKNFMLEISF